MIYLNEVLGVFVQIWEFLWSCSFAGASLGAVLVTVGVVVPFAVWSIKKLLD